MPFANTNSVVATDLNNMLRGLYRDNTDRAVTGTLTETDLASTSVTGGTIGSTGALHVVAAGKITTATDTKRVRLYLGATALVDTTAKAGVADWWIDCWIFNTAANAQRVSATWHDHADATNFNYDQTTAAIDTASNATLKVTGTLANAADTITQTMFDVFVVQVT